MMTNSDILRRIRYIFNYSDTEMMELFAMANHQVTRSQISNWLKKEDDPYYQNLNDFQLATFLNGFIIGNRGKKEGPPPVAEKQLTNNIILRKLKIALDLKDVDMLDVLELAGMVISKHELSAFFRSPDQTQYRVCNDQILRNFLQGLKIKYGS